MTGREEDGGGEHRIPEAAVMTTVASHHDRWDEMFELYKVRVEEYHFQVNLNWERTRYFLPFNVGVVGLATGLLRFGVDGRAQILVSSLFLFGVVAALLSLAAHNGQHNYYRRARDSFRVIEDELELPEEHRLGVTPRMRDEHGFWRRANVTNAINLLLGLLAVLNGLGLVYVVWFA
ncbi:MAG: hypothetical protein ABR592_04255 [Nitriliruptorales bacterium]